MSALDVARVYAHLLMLDHGLCPALVLVMDVLLWGPMPVPTCRERFDLLHDHLRQPGGKIGKTDRNPDRCSPVCSPGSRRISYYDTSANIVSSSPCDLVHASSLDCAWLVYIGYSVILIDAGDNLCMAVE